MKTFLMAAALLMTGASVYGIVDYNKKAGSKEFKELYKENHAPAESESNKVEAPLVPLTTKKVVSPAEDKKAATKAVKKSTNKKTAKQKKDIRKFQLKEFSRGKLG